MAKSRLRILDWYVHQGQQRELFKLDHDFYLVGMNGGVPEWNLNHRSLSSNVTLINEGKASTMDFDVVLVRSPVRKERYEPFIKKGSKPIALIQTTTAYAVPSQCQQVIWNSYEVMKRYAKSMSGPQHHYIVHGYDPDEFKPMDLKKNHKILTVANVFKRRSEIMGYNLWIEMLKTFKNMEVIGHGNEDISKKIKETASFEELIKVYNTYSIYFNPTLSSAMPRSRAEAAMCGMPIVSTNNFDIGMYFSHRKNAILSNEKSEIRKGINDLLNSEKLRREFGAAAREVAITHFHIKDYLQKWNDVLDKV